jgi:hypothetical protein
MNKILTILILVFLGLLIVYITRYFCKIEYSNMILKSEVNDFECIILNRSDVIKSLRYLSVADLIYKTGQEGKIINKHLCTKWKPEYGESIKNYYNDRFKEENASVRKFFIFNEYFENGTTILNAQCPKGE